METVVLVKLRKAKQNFLFTYCLTSGFWLDWWLPIGGSKDLAVTNILSESQCSLDAKLQEREFFPAWATCASYSGGTEVSLPSLLVFYKRNQHFCPEALTCFLFVSQVLIFNGHVVSVVE
jgi:hypothetical protein